MASPRGPSTLFLPLEPHQSDLEVQSLSGQGVVDVYDHAVLYHLDDLGSDDLALFRLDLDGGSGLDGPGT